MRANAPCRKVHSAGLGPDRNELISDIEVFTVLMQSVYLLAFKKCKYDFKCGVVYQPAFLLESTTSKLTLFRNPGGRFNRFPKTLPSSEGFSGGISEGFSEVY